MIMLKKYSYIMLLILTTITSIFFLKTYMNYKELLSIKQKEYNSLNQYYFTKYKTFIDFNFKKETLKIVYTDIYNLQGTRIVLWISDKHCAPCIESICKLLEQFTLRYSIKNIIILSSVNSERSFKDLCNTFPNLKFLKSTIDYKAFSEHDYNSPILMVQDSNYTSKILFIPEKEFATLTSFYLTRVKDEFNLK